MNICPSCKLLGDNRKYWRHGTKTNASTKINFSRKEVVMYRKSRMHDKMWTVILTMGLVASLTIPGLSANLKLALYFSGPQKMVEEIEAGFEEEHGDVIDVYGFKRILAEMATGEIQADLVWGGEQIMYMQMRDKGWLHQYISPQISYLNPSYQLGNGYFTPANLMYVVIVYNNRLVAEENAPSTWDDLLSPYWSGRIAFTDVTQAPPALVTTSGLLQLHSYDWSFVEDLQANGVLLTTSQSEVGDRVATGEALVGIMPHAGALSQIKQAKQKQVESPLEVVWPTQGTIPLIRPIAIIAKQDRAPELTGLAKEFVDYVLSPTAQQIGNKYGMITVRADVSLPSDIPEALDIIDLDWDWIYEHEDELKQRFEDIFYRN
jgi:iron(III) transport system substrate-binding protein